MTNDGDLQRQIDGLWHGCGTHKHALFSGVRTRTCMLLALTDFTLRRFMRMIWNSHRSQFESPTKPHVRGQVLPASRESGGDNR